MIKLSYRKAPMTGAAASRINDRFTGIHKKGGRIMITANIILIFIGIIGLMISFGSLIVAFLTFLDKRSKKK